MKNKVKVWLKDQYYGFKTLGHAICNRSPARFWVSTELTGDPVVVIPGIMQKWNIFRRIAPALVYDNHPVYVVKSLGRNLRSIEESAKLVKKEIDRHNLTNVILIGHSKGGLIGKYLLAYHNPEAKIKKLITIATPFAGSISAKRIPVDFHRQLIPGSKILEELGSRTGLNPQITNYYSALDSLIVPNESAVLTGGKNIQLDNQGHHMIMLSDELCELIRAEVELVSKDL